MISYGDYRDLLLVYNGKILIMDNGLIALLLTKKASEITIPEALNPQGVAISYYRKEYC